MIQVGQSYTLSVLKTVDFGVFLDAENLGEVLLPRQFIKQELSVGDSVRVFLYVDSDGRTTATTQNPKAKVGEFAYLEVKDVGEFGAFLDWGLPKDVLVPFGQQHVPLVVGKSYIVYLYIDNEGRITASSKIDRFLDKEDHQFEPKQMVNLIIANTTDLGYKAIVNNNHWGVLYEDDVFERLSFGQSKRGFIKNIRLDGKLDLTLHGGQETRDKNTRIIEAYLRKENGFAPVHDKSDPKEISKLFGMSKGAFKKAIGGLFKQGVITIEKDGIRVKKP